MIRALYTMLWYFLLPVPWVTMWFRGRKAPDYRMRWSERHMYHGAPNTLPACVWVHAVSVGETLAAVPMIEELLRRYPTMPILVTTTTPTGSDRVKDIFGDRVHHVYFPWDIPRAWQRFFLAYNPKLIIMVETELWPNLMAKAVKEQVPVWLFNGRSAERSYQGYRRLNWLTGPAIRAYEGLMVQTEEEAERYIKLGVQKDRVHVTGSVKFDLRLTACIKQEAAQVREMFGRNRWVWVAASTHEGEEEIVLAAHQQVLAVVPNALLVLVPRHPERFDSVAELSAKMGLPCVRRSLNEQPQEETAVYLGDTMGELLMLYGAAELAFVGGSFAPIGGHNLLEPAAWEHPVLSGPQLFNFERIGELLGEAGALTIVQNADELAQAVVALLQDDERREQEGRAAADVVAAHGGALQKTLTLLERVWPA